MAEKIYCRWQSPLGVLTMSAEDNVLTGLWFENQKYSDSRILTAAEGKPCCPVLEETVFWLECYFNGGIPQTMPELRLEGSEFQMEVWQLLRSIPYGETVTYGELAAGIAKRRCISRMSAQAVGGAVGRNPIALIVPCHRVLGADRRITGYGGGLEKKRFLLKLEKIEYKENRR